MGDNMFSDDSMGITDVENFMEALNKSSKEMVLAHFATVLGMIMAAGDGNTMRRIMHDYINTAVKV